MKTRTWNATHGTMSCYKTGCRLPECVQAERDYTNNRRRLIAYGRPTTTLVDAEPARQHAKALMNLGWGIAQLQERAGGSMVALVYGRPAIGRPPTERVSQETARKLLEIPLVLIPTTNLVDGAGTRRRIQALYFLGYSLTWQAEQSGVGSSILLYLASGKAERVMARSALAIRDLYDRMWDVPAPDGPVVRRVRQRAEERGYLPPMSFDDDLIDLPDADLQAELSRRTAAMDSAELHRCYRASLEGDRSPLIVAAAEEYLARRREKRTKTAA